MKKKISIIVSVAALLAALAVFVCNNPSEWMNPMDKNGNDYLEGHNGDEGYEDVCLKPDENGIPIFWTDSVKCPRCDGVQPTIALVGSPSVTISTQELSKFKKWMHLDGGSWNDLITFTKGENGKGREIPFPEEPPCLKEDNSSSYNCSMTATSSMPPVGGYTIKYRVTKLKCGDKEPSAEITRSLIIIPPEVVDTGTPAISLTGNPNGIVEEVITGSRYIDRGVTVTLNGATRNELLDKVTVRGTNGYSKDRLKPNIAFPDTMDASQASAPVGIEYTITYYASYKTSSVVRERKVKVVSDNTGGAEVIIVLKPYKHKLNNGAEAEGPDTMLLAGSPEVSYVEKGVKEAYYLNAGQKVDLTSSVKTPSKSAPGPGKPPTCFVECESDSRTKTVTYTVDAGAGYKKGEVKRTVFLVDGGCATDGHPPVAPTITTSGSDKISAGVPWNYDASWSVRGMDFSYKEGFKYFIHFGTLDPSNPKVGKYTITYVGVGGCGARTEETRVITVE